MKNMTGKAPKTRKVRKTWKMTNSSAALAAAGGVLLAAFPFLRPWGDKIDGAGAADMIGAFASPMWVAAHVAGMIGFVLLAAAALAHGRGGARWWLAGGVALILPFFGAEAFGLHVIAGSVPQDAAIVAADGIREGEVQMTMFGVGLLAIAVGGVLLARRSRTAILLAFALVTYLPQFFFGPEVRMAHGAILLVGAAWWAWALVREAAPGRREAAVPATQPTMPGVLA